MCYFEGVENYFIVEIEEGIEYVEKLDFVHITNASGFKIFNLKLTQLIIDDVYSNIYITEKFKPNNEFLYYNVRK